MADSCFPGPCGTNPWASPTRTGGPMGSNGDAGDPSTPSWFLGNTPGPVGHNDHADPNGKMCSLSPQPYSTEWYLAEKRIKRKSDYQKVRAELAEVYKIRDGFADPGVLQEAKKKDWSTAQYDAKVKEKVFGSPENVSTENYVSPMGTNPFTCRTTENWNINTYRSKGYPDIIYEADKAHEASHRQSCESHGKGSLQYSADMSFPDRFSEDEIKAYTVKIVILEKWLRENSW